MLVIHIIRFIPSLQAWARASIRNKRAASILPTGERIVRPIPLGGWSLTIVPLARMARPSFCAAPHSPTREMARWNDNRGTRLYRELPRGDSGSP
jgi:hypothetical protein